MDGHSPTYGIGSGGNSTSFNITGTDTLMFEATPSVGNHTVIVTASGGSVFEDGNNWRELEITVAGAGPPEGNNPPDVDAGSDLVLAEGASLTLSGNATDQDADDTLTYSWSQSPATPAIGLSDDTSLTPTITAPAVDADATFILTLTASDGTDPGSDDIVVTVKETGSAFITTWKTDAAGEGITIPGTGTYSVIWGDGEFSDGVSGHVSHEYETPGTHTISITGDLEKIHLGSAIGNAQKLQSIEQWGGIEWDTMESAFRGASNMEYHATDAPDLSGVTDMDSMFSGATSFNGDLSSWNVSQVTHMGDMFFSATAFNQNLSPWNVSQVTHMGDMFFRATAFNQNLSPWNVSKVTDMNSMFSGATSFNGDVSPWNVSEVTGMNNMFSGAIAFNGDISSWNVSKVTHMGGMFWGATSFNGDISSWNVSQVTNMFGMFNTATSFNQNLSSWNVSKATNMYSMFNTATSFDGDLSEWDVSQVTDMNSMFSGATSFNQNLSSWNVSQVTYMYSMFSGATSFNQNLSSWNVSQVTDMNGMFNGATLFNGDISSWDVSEVAYTGGMFRDADAFNQDLNDWNVSQVTDMNRMFYGATSFNGDISSWDVSQVTFMTSMFLGATSFDQNLGNWYVVPADTAYDTSEGTLNVTTVSAQNLFLDGHSPNYGIGSGGDSASFNITGTDTLIFEATPSARGYAVNVTASGDDVFEGENNWRMLEITVTGETADTTLPTITLNGTNPDTVPVGFAYVEPGATCTDDTDGSLPVTISGTVDTSNPGTHTVTYTCTDSSGNESTISRTVTVVAAETPIDTTYPVITLNGPSTLTITAGTTYTEQGATCTDDTDGSLQVTTIGTVDASALGIHTLAYTCTNSSGNESTATRQVRVVAAWSPEDNNPPRVNAGPDQTVGEGDTVALSGSATDPDAGDAIESYSWSAPPGSGITLADGSSASTTFTAPAVEAETTFTLTLTAGDGTDSGSDDVDVTVRDTGSCVHHHVEDRLCRRDDNHPRVRHVLRDLGRRRILRRRVRARVARVRDPRDPHGQHNRRPRVDQPRRQLCKRAKAAIHRAVGRHQMGRDGTLVPGRLQHGVQRG